MPELFYTITFSPDDGGYYAEVFGRDGHTVAETPLFPTRAAVRAAIRAQYPTAQEVQP